MSLYNLDKEALDYDVVICGGGLAGQTLARQLKMQFADITILILERATFPLPESTAKVGESTASIGGYYLSEMLYLDEYLKNSHYEKLGFRFYFGDSQQPFEERPELGINEYPYYKAFQIDRGPFETDLCRMNVLEGTDVQDGVSIRDIHLAEEGSDELHSVTVRNKDGDEATVKGRWVIDAMGRGGFLQRKLGLRKMKKEKPYSSVWFHVEGRLDVEDFVSLDNKEWHKRIEAKKRFFATNHLLGKGYWFWIIPLTSKKTSIGLVTQEAYHPFETYNTPEAARQWISQHEPDLSRHLEGKDFIDFKKLKNYSYSAKQVFSTNRWACSGESAVFPDPLYSPGTNLIAYENTIIRHLISLDVEGRLEQRHVEHFNHYILSQNDWLTHTIQSAYSYFDNSLVYSLNFIWDLSIDWSFGVPQVKYQTFLYAADNDELQQVNGRLFSLVVKMQSLFAKWGEKSQRRFTFGYIDYHVIPFLQHFLRIINEEGEIEDKLKRCLEKLEELALVIFHIALEDCNPEWLEQMPDPFWLNAWAISLDPERWEKDGLFKPASSPRDLSRLLEEMKSLYIDTMANGELPEEQDNELSTAFNFS
ncbi:NAD(P)/FAD-dependent oxidoreductase [Roseivirga sp. BDSF3-8]|uniref:NAD(P)/FAD-dependent oxidoreductase n=1 Tax=Roseivirga sp. BDSF3-8 TaxID=3241598 RepID=UPI003531C3BA